MPRRRRSDRPLNRREFLGSSALNAAGVAAGVVGWTALSGAAVPAGTLERVRVGVIGVRNQGKQLAMALAALPDAEVATLCDVDASLLAVSAQAVADRQRTAPKRESDFRRVLDDRTVDAVVIAVPDHWHAAMAALACDAGKDVYLETPATHALDQGQKLLPFTAARGRVVQTGLQQRSGAHFQTAIDYVQSGKLGQVSLVKAWTVHQRKSIGLRKEGQPPEGVDYDLWLGPAAARPFQPNRFHYNWHWFWDYGSGELGNWGVNLLDVARWGLGVEYPERVSAAGGKFHFHDDQQTPDTLHVAYTYPHATITWEHRLCSSQAPEGRSAAVAICGDRGTLIVDRGGWKVYGQTDVQASDGADLLATHLRNFIDCVKSRQLPAASLETGIVSSALCHLGNIAFRSGRNLHVNPATGTIAGDPLAAELALGKSRPQWALGGLST
ncbi:MAG: Gfo/Idh/MocA family protein [Planctomycetaceae bacterium]